MIGDNGGSSSFSWAWACGAVLEGSNSSSSSSSSEVCSGLVIHCSWAELLLVGSWLDLGGWRFAAVFNVGLWCTGDADGDRTPWIKIRRRKITKAKGHFKLKLKPKSGNTKKY